MCQLRPPLTAQADRLYLYEFFAPHGAVLSVRVLTDDAGACRGVGFVNYADNSSALAAVQARAPAPMSLMTARATAPNHHGGWLPSGPASHNDVQQRVNVLASPKSMNPCHHKAFAP